MPEKPQSNVDALLKGRIDRNPLALLSFVETKHVWIQPRPDGEHARIIRRRRATALKDTTEWSIQEPGERVQRMETEDEQLHERAYQAAPNQSPVITE